MSTTLELEQYYANLLILQYKQKPKAYATILALVAPVIMDQLPLQVQNAFTIGTAVGKQLDVLGKYAGVTRYGYTFTGPVTLGDVDFTKLIQISVVQNSAGSSLSDIQNLLQQFFAGVLFIYDHADMSIDYFVDLNAISLTLLEFFIEAGKLPRPMGVGIGAIIAALDITHFFSFRTYLYPVVNGSGFNFYSSYLSGTPWLSYGDSIIV